VKSELRKKDDALEASREENTKLCSRIARLTMAKRSSLDGSPVVSSGNASGGRDSDFPSSSGSDGDDERSALRIALEENAALRRFLKDYGMTWVGDSAETVVTTDAYEQTVIETHEAKARSNQVKKVRSSRLMKRADAARASNASTRATVVASAASSRKPMVENPKPKIHPEASGNPRPKGSAREFKVDVEKLVASIAELNAVAGDGTSTIVVGKNGARELARVTCKTVTLFRDGFIVDDAAETFRPFTEACNVSYVRDLCDGYFPYEYKEVHPNGVPFKLIDRTDASGARADAFEAFTGSGARLDGRKKTVEKKVDANGGTGTLFATAAAAAEKVPGKGSGFTEKPRTERDAAFLRELPRVVVRNGSVIDIRESVGNALRDSSSPSRTVLETTVSRGCFRDFLEREARASSDAALDDEARGNVVGSDASTFDGLKNSLSRLRVKGMDGQKMYVVTLAAEDTVGKLRLYLQRAVGGEPAAPEGDRVSDQSGNTFEIRNAYPPKTFTDDSVTLRDAGLVPNATLLLRRA
jgi:hypothetical protein